MLQVNPWESSPLHNLHAVNCCQPDVWHTARKHALLAYQDFLGLFSKIQKYLPGFHVGVLRFILERALKLAYDQTFLRTCPSNLVVLGWPRIRLGVLSLSNTYIFLLSLFWSLCCSKPYWLGAESVLEYRESQWITWLAVIGGSRKLSLTPQSVTCSWGKERIKMESQSQYSTASPGAGTEHAVFFVYLKRSWITEWFSKTKRRGRGGRGEGRDGAALLDCWT